MRATEMVERMAEWFGVPHETAVVVDRALADANLRTKGRGRAPQKMRLEDAVALALALTAHDRPTRAAQVAADLLDFTAVKVVPEDDTTKEDAEALLAQPLAEVESGHRKLPELLQPIFDSGAPRPDVWIKWEDRGPLQVCVQSTDMQKACRVEFAGVRSTEPDYDYTRGHSINMRRLAEHFA